jgi:PAS domain S-box-containing protein
MTLTRRLLLLAFISVLPAIVIWTFTEVTLRRDREAEIRDLALRQAHLAASEIDRIVEGVRGLLVAVGEVSSVRSFDPESCGIYLSALRPKVPYLISLWAMDRDGVIRCQPDGAALHERYDDRTYFREAIARNDFVVGEYTVGKVTGRKTLPLALPLHGPSGEITGVLVAALDLNWLGQRLSERSLPTDGSITVADTNGVIIAREPFPDRFIGTVIPDAYLSLVHAAKPGAVDVLSQDGTRRVLGYIPVTQPLGDLYVSAGISSKEAFGTIDAAARRGFLLIAAAFLLALALSTLSSRVFITRPFNMMIAAVRAWRSGAYSARVTLPAGSGELGVLAEAVNDLMDDVARRQSELQDSEAKARLALEAGHMGTWWFDLVGRNGEWSDQTAQLLGRATQPRTATLADWSKSIHPDDRDAVRRTVQAAMKGSGDFEAEFRVPGDGERWLDSRGRVLFDQNRRPVRIIGVVHDITARKQAEAQQRLLLDELNHRVKNTLATVQSIAGQTLRSTTQPAEFRQAFESRLLALSKTHDLLTRNAWRAADLNAIVEQEVAPYRRDSEERISIRGPEVSLPARAAINLGLVLHELMTNAAKYGALSGSEGHLDLGWTVAASSPGGPILHLSWQERGGPPVEEPQREGFGSKLLRRGIEGELGGRVAVKFPPTGVVGELFIPLGTGTLGAETGSGSDDLDVAV